MEIIEHYKFEPNSKWDEEVNMAVLYFQAKHMEKPCILLASTTTFDKIDLMADKCHVSDENDCPATQDWVTLRAFNGENYRLQFCVDNNLPDGSFALVFDPRAEFGEEARH